MAIARRGTPVGVVDNRGVNTIVLPVPTGSTTGDVMYAFMGSIGVAPVTMPAQSGWTKVGERQNPGTDNTTSYIYRRAASASEPANYTFTFGSNGKSVGIIVAYSGVDLTAAATPVFAVTGAVDAPPAISSPPVQLVAGDWLATYVFGRQSPATDDVKSWTTNTIADPELVDAYSNEVGTSRAGTHALWDSGVPLAGGASPARILTVSPAIQQTHVWSLRIPVLVVAGGGGSPTAGTWSHVGIPIR